jgi:hypothetical protein
MEIGAEVTYDGRRYAVVGFTPVSATPFRVELLDRETNRSLWVDWPPVKTVERAALRAVSKSDGDEEDGEQPAP